MPWLQTLRGREQVPAFFAALGAVELTKFEPKKLLGDSDCAVAVIDAAFTVKATGKRVVETDEGHVWHFNAGGEVSRFRPPGRHRPARDGAEGRLRRGGVG